MERGKFIVVEGGEGSGKTTLLSYAREQFPDAVMSREPGGAAFAEKIRSLILSPEAKDANANTHFGLFWASRADHMHNTIAPALTEGKNVICDRFDSSSYAYQIHGQENGYLKDLFLKMREIYLQENIPDMYIFLSVDVKEGLRRRAQAKGKVNHFDERDISFHERVKRGYLEFFESVPHVVIDANLPLETVKSNFIKTLCPLLSK